MKIFVVRHGETIWNRIGRTQGRSQNRLSELGKQQAKIAGENLKDKNIDLIISSPLFRTVQTSNFINLSLNKKIIKDNRIIEIDQGIYTGRFKKDLTNEEEKRKNLKLKADGCESYFEVYERVKDFICDIKNKYANKNIVIVTHRTPAVMTDLILNNKEFSIQNYENIKGPSNGEVRVFEVN